ncbi:transporter substrate-binding domain-containing protein [Celeribacter persicus]|jgi:ABC-type amino acid transport/signal transduction systems, periplasmic component/domain|uniref:Amino acid ABC transporter substrate-binding protein (PAAT family) n=1 Tax=Celeribacter persicus TaxID=1651082 RepID=A0A2T5HTU5_9RHOB|nr:transporter substrate-binding domain-containing protein [Celeribacter persicus]PTQ74956.1 amino acid ABC transporter substrate-binding protein (PAAT family) [Celeribacter persicus]
MKLIFRFLAALFVFLSPATFSAESHKIMTITRVPFSMEENGKETGFSLELWDALAEELGWEYEVSRVSSFPEMLGAIQNGSADAAIANISITANRELVMDFSQPIFEAGLQIMTDTDGSDVSIWSAVISRDMLIAIAGAFALLFGGGMLMWYFEKHHQDYFDMPARKAMFPAFWWALNLVVNGGFEERQPRSPMGRVFGVFLVISSLFLVSVFVARITAVLTIDAIQSNVSGIGDLYGKSIGTVEASTAADFLERRDLRFTGYANPTELIEAFEAKEVDAVVFDAPILAYYVAHEGKGKARLVGPIFLPENYGIALPTNSPYADQINHSLLKLREDGTYDTIYRKWFGAK